MIPQDVSEPLLLGELKRAGGSVSYESATATASDVDRLEAVLRMQVLPTVSAVA